MKSTPAPLSTACGRGQHLVGRRRGEHLARARGVEHAVADEAGVQRLVARAAARDQRDLARLQLLRRRTNLRSAPRRDDVGMRGGEAVERFGEHVVDVVDEFLHGTSGDVLRWLQRLSQIAPMIKRHRARAGIDVAERALAEERRAARGSRPSSRSPRRCRARTGARGRRRSAPPVAGSEHALHRIEHVEQRLLADLGLAEAASARRCRRRARRRSRAAPRLRPAAPSPSVTSSVPNTGPDEPPIVAHAGHAHRLQRVVRASGPRQLGELRLDRQRAALHVEAVVAVADRLVERGQLVDVIDQRLACAARISAGGPWIGLRIGVRGPASAGDAPAGGVEPERRGRARRRHRCPARPRRAPVPR